MNIGAYIKDRLSFIIVYFLSNIFTIIIMQLDRLREGRPINPESAAYALLLGLFFLIIIVSADYIKKRPVYKTLRSIKDGNLSEVFKVKNVYSSEHNFFIKILKKIYHEYEDSFSAYRDRQKEHLYFINQWAHQMKTPVSVISLILEENEDNLGKDQALSIREETEKLSHGLEMAIYTSRISDFEQDFIIEKVDIIQAARDVINSHKKEFIRYSIFPKIVSNANIFVETDAKWIRFVINQIISNSIKYSRLKDAKREVLIEPYDNGNSVILSIRDNGIGIPAEDIKRVFKPFFTGVNGRKFPESTGMGMYLSKVICEKLGHKIYIESEEGAWTKLTIIFSKGRACIIYRQSFILYDNFVRYRVCLKGSSI